jgi:hypothetical protein
MDRAKLNRVFIGVLDLIVRYSTHRNGNMKTEGFILLVTYNYKTGPKSIMEAFLLTF